jgi:hypothetical protein
MKALITAKRIESIIYTIRGKKVMLDSDLAALYGVSTKVLNQAVKRNLTRFPDDFMFRLTVEEAEVSRSQIVTLNKRGQNVKYLPYAFTEYGVAMLSSVLRSKKAIAININIIKAFIRLRQMVTEHSELRLAIERLERRVDKHDMQIQVAFNSLKRLLDYPFEPVPPRRGSVPFGFVPKKNPS